jgi:hypothetical protein
VRGKGRTEERLPLPPDVGAAIAAYLRQGRPRRPEREVFLRVCAPLRALSPDGVSEVVRMASERSGLGSFGAHRLRHTAATQMLQAGASLPEAWVPQLLSGECARVGGLSWANGCGPGDMSCHCVVAGQRVVGGSVSRSRIRGGRAMSRTSCSRRTSVLAGVV